MLSYSSVKMLGEMCFGISKTQRPSKAGFLFFLLLQMTLLSKVWPDTSTVSPTESAAASQSVSPTHSDGTTVQMSMATSDSYATTALSVAVSTGAVNNTGTVSGNASSSTGNYSVVSCPSFVCTTDCLSMSVNATVKPCPSSAGNCEILKQDMSYSVGCSASCGVSCGNSSLSNCSVSCCNTTNCLNFTQLPSATAATTKPTSTTVTTKTTIQVTTANNGKKCHSIKCDGTTCYKTITAFMMCPVGQDYCMLKKTTTGNTESWEGGCSLDCRKQTVCAASVTACHLECCNATTSASCLKLTGEVNMPSSASRGPQSPALVVASILLLWIMRVFT